MRIWSQQWQWQNDLLQVGVAVQDAQNRVRQVRLLLEAQSTPASLQKESTNQPPSAMHGDASGLALPEEVQNGKLTTDIMNIQLGKTPKLLVGDIRRFKQVLINLVKNAIKFTKSGHIKIKVCYNSNQYKLVVHVEDTGQGITKEDLPKLFTRFGKL